MSRVGVAKRARLAATRKELHACELIAESLGHHDVAEAIRGRRDQSVTLSAARAQKAEHVLCAVEAWIKKHDVSCEAAIYQTDRVQEALPLLAEKVCAIVWNARPPQGAEA